MQESAEVIEGLKLVYGGLDIGTRMSVAHLVTRDMMYAWVADKKTELWRALMRGLRRCGTEQGGEVVRRAPCWQLVWVVQLGYLVPWQRLCVERV